MPTFNSQDFKIGPCAVIFKGDILGVTRSASQLTFRGTYYDSKCSRAYEQSLGKRLTSMTISLTTEIMSVDNGLGLFLDEDDRITLDKLGERQNPYGGELLLIPISPSDMVAYRFPKAVLLLNSTCSFNENEEHTLKLEFEAGFVEGEEILFERIPVDEAQRVSLTTSSDIESAALERAMTAYLADKMNLTVDTDIFRGGLPPNVDGCAVELLRVEADNPISSRSYYFSFFSVDVSRDTVMEKVKSLADSFPVYGENLLVEGTDGVTCQLMEMLSCEFSKQTADNGKVKYCGELFFKILI